MEVESAGSDAISRSLRTFAASQPSIDRDSGQALTTIVVAGPYDSTAANADPSDVDPVMAEALASAGFTRPRDTHLRVYKVPA